MFLPVSWILAERGEIGIQPSQMVPLSSPSPVQAWQNWSPRISHKPENSTRCPSSNRTQPVPVPSSHSYSSLA